MRSALTPRIFRRIIENERIAHRDCLSRRSIGIRRPVQPCMRQQQQQRRSLFGWISPVPKEAMLATGEKAALTFLKDACSRFDNRIRPPPTSQLIRAWTTFIRERRHRGTPLTDIEAKYTQRVLQYLREEDDFKKAVGVETLVDAIFCIQHEGVKTLHEEARDAYVNLSTSIFNEIETRFQGLELEKAAEIATVSSGHKKEILYTDVWIKHNQVVSTYGHGREALELLRASNVDAKTLERGWRILLQRAYTGQAGAVGMSEMIDAITKSFGSLSKRLSMAIAVACAQQCDFANAKKYAGSIESIGISEDAIQPWQIRDLLDACRKHNELSWGQEVIKSLTKDSAAMRKYPELWTATFAWALGTGKSVDEVNRMKDVMVRTNPVHQPDNDTINSLIRVANEKKDPYLAERLIALGQKWGIEPDIETYLLQMDYRLSVSDIEGARTAFDYVKSFGGNDADDTPRINSLIQAMVRKGTYPFESIMDPVEFLGERNGRFSSATVSALTVLHLNREEYHDVADILQENMSDFSATERAEVRTAVFDLMLSPGLPLGRVWDSYMIYQRIFEEAPRVERIKIMQRFFELQRSDMALHVFTHMRHHASPDVNPNTDAFVAALLGCGTTEDRESLALVHNVLKLDIHVEETTRLHNAKMIAFFGCGEPDKAQTVWEDIISSSEGPNFNSLLLIFRVCEQSDFGEVRARGVWGLLRKMDVPLDSELVGAYVGALAGNGCDIEARQIVESAEKELGVEVDEHILTKLFNTASSTVKQVDIRKWIEERYPQIWASLEAKGLRRRWNGTLVLPLEIKMEP